MKNSIFSFKLTPSNPAAKLGFEVWINEQCMFETDHVNESIEITGDLPADNIEAEHTLRLILKNKQPEHTQVDESGNIVADSLLEITELTFDEVALGQIVNDLTVYNHDFNGSQAPIQEQFFGTMGCNGSVELKFTTPIYLWLLENM